MRSVMDELLSRLTKPLPAPGRPMMLLLAMEDCEPRRIMRLVWMFPMGSGEVVCERKAAAAAADDNEAVEGELFRKALLAASVADALGGGSGRGCGTIYKSAMGSSPCSSSNHGSSCAGGRYVFCFYGRVRWKDSVTYRLGARPSPREY